MGALAGHDAEDGAKLALEQMSSSADFDQKASTKPSQPLHVWLLWSALNLLIAQPTSFSVYKMSHTTRYPVTYPVSKFDEISTPREFKNIPSFSFISKFTVMSVGSSCLGPRSLRTCLTIVCSRWTEMCFSYPVSKLYPPSWCALLKQILPKRPIESGTVPDRNVKFIQGSLPTSISSFSWSIAFSYFSVLSEPSKTAVLFTSGVSENALLSYLFFQISVVTGAQKPATFLLEQGWRRSWAQFPHGKRMLKLRNDRLMFLFYFFCLSHHNGNGVSCIGCTLCKGRPYCHS